jgi:hypothetical protein
MRMALVICLRCSRFSCFCPDFKKWCRGDMSRASSVPVVQRSTVHLAIPSCLPLMASLIRSTGDLADVTLGSQQPVVVPVPVVPSAGGAS